MADGVQWINLGRWIGHPNLEEFVIVRESNDLKANLMIDSYTRDPLDTSDEEEGR